MSMLRCFLPLISFLLLAYLNFGQSQTVDSLKALLGTKAANSDTASHRLYLELADEYLKINLDSALIYAQKAFDLASKLDHKPLLPSSQYKMAEVYIRQRKPQEALPFARLAEAGFLALGDTLKMLKASNAIGGTYSQMNDLPKAAAQFYQAKKLAEHIGDKRTTWAIANNIAMIENRRGNYSTAIDLYLDALELGKGVDDPNVKMNSLNGLANNYELMGEHEKSIEAREEQISLAKQTGDKRVFALATSNLAKSYLLAGNVEQAEMTALEADKLLVELGANHVLANNYQILGAISIKQERLGKAIEYFGKALNTFGNTPEIENIANAHQKLSECFEKLGETDLAFSHFKQYAVLRDSALRMEAGGKLEEIKTQYETEKKEQQNQMLTAQNAALSKSRNIYLVLASLLGVMLFTLLYFFIKNRKQKRQIELHTKELEENARLKSKLFSIVAHDLRSPLVSLGGIAKKVNFLIQRNRVEEVQQLGDSVEQAVAHVHKLLDNLLSWAMVQGGRFPYEPETIQLAEALRETVELYRHSAEAKNITLLFHAPPESQIRCDKNAFSTIVRNLLDNAIKFTPPNGQVAVEAKLEKEFALIQVRDSGRGIDEAAKQSLFSLSGKKGTQGTLGEKGTGLGLTLCKELVEMNGGNIEVSSQAGLGATFFVSLPSAS